MSIFGKDLKLDYKSLKFKLWAYFLIFTVALLAVIWALQVYFLNEYYEDMKISETKDTVKSIQSHYKDEDILEKIKDIYKKNDMYIQIETGDGVILFSPTLEESWQPSYVYYSEIQAVRDALMESEKNSVSVIIKDPYTSSNTLAYACFLENVDGGTDILYVFSPLYPISSTVDIIRKQLLYITIIAIIMALIVAFVLSRRIVKPIATINNSAKQLANGRFGIVFEGGEYSEVKDLADTLTYTSIELEKSRNLQKDLIANVSHDLRTPLTMVKSYAEMVRDLSGDNPEKRNEHLNVIIDEADRLNLLVGDMLSMSRMQSGAVVLHKEEFNFSKTLEHVLQAYEILKDQEGYVINVDCKDNIWVNADPERIKQVLNNLITNAVKYCGDDKAIDILVRQDGKYGHGGVLHFEVSDHGMGINKDELDKIWDRYYKASTNHMRSVSGTGLGLSIVKEILLLHGAKFGVESELGHGSTFWFELKADNN